MKRFIVFLILIYSLFSYQSTSFASDSTSDGETSVYDAIQKGEKQTTPKSTKDVDSQSTTLFPSMIKFFVSFIFVIGLLYFLMRFLSKRNRPFQGNGPILSLGGQSLGNNRSLQVVLLGQTIYIIGVGETISLIRTIEKGEEYQSLLEGFENQAEVLTPKWLTLDSKKNGTLCFVNI
ncbi:flagellar biosynthetic protein FliO [Bacillus sp. T3]|uniref:flagellar biosynthetic protein FliO n=1 Tax=Bacillus sp. T3 TaxID=467262 RepID=UPI0029825CE7|nr:flagellar biosynthetic protein FliO [Bacillus sp. T3]